MAKWYLLHEGELTDAPGRMERFEIFVRPLKCGRWELSYEGSDFVGLETVEPETERMSTRALVDWALEREYYHEDPGATTESDEQDAEDDGEGRRSLGVITRRLREIAVTVRAKHCVRILDRYVAGEWPPGPKILSIDGPARRPVWRDIYHDVIAVTTNRGPAYLYPPKGRTGQVHFGGNMTGERVKLSVRQLKEAEAVLLAQRAATDPARERSPDG
jgi:hypothetical protein